MADPLDEFSSDPLTPRENQKARKMFSDQARMEWLWATGRIWAGYLSSAIAAVYFGWDHIRDLLKKLFS